MPKKKRSRTRSQYRKSTAARTMPRAEAPSGATAAPPPPQKVDFATEYQYVIGDLRHIAILAVAMFATLIVLALVIR